MSQNNTIKVNLQFEADTSKAKRQMRDLQSTLNSVVNQQLNSTMGDKMAVGLSEATRHATQLKVALQAATNVNTGKLNLNQFQQQLQASGLSIKQLANSLKSLGPEGVAAFNQMTQAMVGAETKMHAMGAGMTKMVNQLLATIRYSISTFIIQGVTGAVRSVVDFAKQLDRSLTDIQYVTGKTTEEMSKMAVQANKIAKTLSVATKTYTEAALIYYQQGLNEAQVQQRAKITIQLAKVTGESAEQVSNWMTAIWNNFDDGSQSLEHYADVLAKLGAATASSVDEIAAGLSKFSAVAETVGLSYERASAMVATVASQTRESAETIGTAFKTIFSRMEGLSLGETLDDGTTLNKYSAALASVGVNIKTVSGNLRDMDSILEDTANVWKTMGRDQQVALAQTVAGVRQYNQFVAMMDTWDVMERNEELAKNSAGAVNDMYKNYEDSVEGHTERMKANLEDAKMALFNTDDATEFYKTLADITESVGSIIKSFGGLKGIILQVAGVLTQLYQPKIAMMFTNMGASMSKGFGIFKSKTSGMTSAALAHATDMEKSAEGGDATVRVQERITALRKLQYQYGDRLTQAEKANLANQIEILEALKEGFRVRQKTAQAAVQKAGESGDVLTEGMPQDTKGARAAANTIAGRQYKSYDTAKPGKGHGISQLQQDLTALGKEAKELGVDLTSLGFDEIMDRLASKTKISQNEFATLTQQIKAMAQEVTNSADKIDESGFGKMDVAHLEAQGQQIGAAQSDVDRAAGLGNRVTTGMNANSRADAASQIRDSVMSGMQSLDIAGVDTETGALGNAFKKVLTELTEFTNKGDSHLDFLKESLKELQQEAEKAGQEFLEISGQTAADAALGDTDALETIKEQKEISTGKLTKDTTSFAGVETKNVKSWDEFKNADSQLQEATSNKDYKELKGKAESGGKLSKKEQKQLESHEKTITALKQKRAKAEKAVRAEVGKMTTQKKKSNKEEQKGGKIDKKNLTTKKQTGRQVKKNTQEEKKNTNQKKKSAKGSEEAAQAASKYAKDTAGATRETNNLEQALKDVEDDGKNMEKNLPMHNIANAMSNGVQAATQYAAAVTSIGSAFEQMAYKARSAELAEQRVKEGLEDSATASDEATSSFRRHMESIGSVGMSIVQLLPSMASMVGAIYAVAAANKKKADAEPGNAAKEKQAEDTKQRSKLGTIMHNLAAQASAGPGGWVTFAISAAMVLAMIGGVVVSAVSGANDGEAKAEQEDAEARKEAFQEKKNQNIEAYSEMNDTFTGLGDSIEEFKELQAAGEDTTDVIKGMTAAVDELVQSMAGLSSDEGFSIDTAGMKSALYKAQYTGDMTEFENLYNQEREKTARAGMEEANELWSSDWSNKENQEKYVQAEYEYLSSGVINRIDKQLADWFADNPDASPEEVTKQFNDLVGKATTRAGEAKTDVLNKQAQGLSQVFWKIMRQAELFNTASSNYAIAKGTSTAEGFANRSEITKEDRDWLNSLSGEDQNYVLSMGDDFDWTNKEEALEKFHTETAKSSGIAKAEELGFDEAIYDAYTQQILDNNLALDGNSEALHKVATQCLSLDKGVKDLAENWEDLNEQLNSGDPLEYSQALGEVHKHMETIFGQELDVDITKEAIPIIQRFMAGEEEALYELQKLYGDAELAAYDFSKGDSVKGIVNDEETQNNLRGWVTSLTNDLQEFNDIEIGEGAQVSGDYIAALEAALLAGQITIEQLEENLAPYGWLTEFKDGKLTIVRSANADSVNLPNKEEEIEQKKYDDEIERYHKIQKAIEDVNRELEYLSEQKDRAFGGSRLALMDAEIAKQKELLALEEQHLAEIEQNLQQDKSYMVGYGATFDENGQITNYEELMKQYIDQYNSGAIDDDQYSLFTESLSKYEETADLYKDKMLEIIQYKDQIFDKELEKVQYTVEFNIEINDRALAMLEYQLEKLDDSIADTATALALIGKQTENNLQKVETYQKGLRDTLSLSGFTEGELESLLGGDMSVLEGKNLTDSQMEQIKEYSDSLLDLNQSLLETYTTIEEKLITAFESMNEDIDEQITKIDGLSAVAQSYKDIIDIVGKDTLGIDNQIMQDLDQALVKTSQEGIRATKAKLDANKASLLEAESALDEARKRNATEDIKMWENVVNSLSATVTEGEEELMSRWSDSLQTAADVFTSAVERVMETFEKAMSGVAGSFEELQSKYDQQSEINQRYIDDYTKIYNLSKLSRNIEKSINQKDNISAQNKLREIQEEVNALQNSNAETTQYELDLLQAKYDLKLAEIALEEAQNAKKQVRMSRDSEGNWGYVYTADQSQIDAAQQGYEDKLYAMQSLMQKTSTDLQASLMSLPQEMAEAMQAITEDFNMSEEEKSKKMNEIYEYYGEKQEYLLSQYKKVNKDSQTLYNEDWKAYAKATDYKISNADKWVDSFEESIYAQVTGYESLEDVQSTFQEAAEELLEDLANEYENWQEAVNEANEAAGVSTEEFAEVVSEECENIIEDSESASEAVIELAEAGEDGFGGLVDAAETYLTSYGSTIDGYITQNESLISSINSIQQAWLQAQATMSNSPLPTNPGGAVDGTLPEGAGGTGDDLTYNSNLGLPETITYRSTTGNATYTDEANEKNLHGQWKEVRKLANGAGYTAVDLAGNTYKVDSDSAKAIRHYNTGRFGNSNFQYVDEDKMLAGQNYIIKGDDPAGSMSGGTGDNINQQVTNKQQDDQAKKAAEQQRQQEEQRAIAALEAKGVKRGAYVHSTGEGSFYSNLNNETGSQKPIEDIDEWAGIGFLPKITNYGSDFIQIENSKGDKLYCSTNAVTPTTDKYVSMNGQQVSLKDPVSIYALVDGKMDYNEKETPYKNPGTINSVFSRNPTTGEPYYYHMNDVGDIQWGDLAWKGYINWTDVKSYKYNLKKFDTGGYTGSWDSSGRLAMLHQKEIVLNAHDTENFLSAIDILRDITKAIDLQAISQSMNLQTLTPITTNPNPSTIEQKIEIHADFPAASNRGEIEAAFDSLINRASQYAFRT